MSDKFRLLTAIINEEIIKFKLKRKETHNQEDIVYYSIKEDAYHDILLIIEQIELRKE